MPAVHTVLSSLSPGSGPRSRSNTTAGRPSSPTEPSRVLRISGRLAIPDSSVPSASAASVASRSSGEDAAGCRISIISSSAISLRAHWMIPTPISSSAMPSVVPSATVEAPSPPTLFHSSPTSKTK